MNGKTAKVVVLDRDGVINRESDDFIKTPAEWQQLPGSIEAIADLSRAGFLITLATNQSGLARGLFDLAALESIHEKFRGLVENEGGAVDGIFFCPHGPNEGCRCRKPATGLLEQIEAEFSLSLRNRWFIGDSLRDLQAARTHGCKPILVRTGNGSITENLLENNGLSDVDVFDNLRQAANALLVRDNGGFDPSPPCGGGAADAVNTSLMGWSAPLHFNGLEGQNDFGFFNNGADHDRYYTGGH